MLAMERYLNQEAEGPRFGYLGQEVEVAACRSDHHMAVTVNPAVQFRPRSPGGRVRPGDQAGCAQNCPRSRRCRVPPWKGPVSVNTQEANPRGEKKQ